MSLGILAGIYGGEYISYPLTILICLAVAYLIALAFLKKDYYTKWYPIFGLLALLLLFFVGFVRVTTFDETNNPKNITHLTDTIKYYQAVTVSETSHTSKSLKNTIKISKVKVNGIWSEATGKMLFYQRKDGTEKLLKYGDFLLVKGSPSLVKPPSNPNEFDYKRYLGFKNMFHQDFTTGGHINIYQHSSPNHLVGISIQIREHLTQIITEKIKGSNERAIALALILGVKDELNSEIKQAYSAAGAMHVLAVSGLHVGIIYLVLIYSLGWLRNKKNGRLIYLLVVISVLWSYALITGFSPSVLRAVTMFSFLLIGDSFYRKTNAYNNLAISAFILLLANPFYIMSVGFQLSYVAVIGILYLQPKIYSWFTFDGLLADKAWAIMSVSLSAQIATFPLIIMYFHQFPTYFFVANLVVIPAAFLILSIGFLMLLFSAIDILSDSLAFLLEGIIYLTNQIIFFIESIPFSTMSNISINSFQSILIYLVIIYSLISFTKKKLSYLKISFLFLILFTTTRIYQFFIQSQQQKIVFYNVQGANVMDFIKGFQHQLVIDSKSDSITNRFDYQVKPNWVKLGVSNDNPAYIQNYDSIGYQLSWQGKNFLIVNSPISNLNSIQNNDVNYIVVNYNAIKNPTPLIGKNIILPSTNHKWYLSKWRAIAETENHHPYNISKEGVLILYPK